MSKYQETSVAAAEYQRCYKITINNPYQQVQTVQFEEEQIIKKADNSVIHDPIYNQILSKSITDFNEVIDIYDPATQTKTGQTTTIASIYALIWSVYMKEALARDRGPQPYPSWVVNETTNTWEAPVAKPNDGQTYYWDEGTQTWVLPLNPQ